MGRASTIVTPPIQCKKCGYDRWFRMIKGILKSERIYSCQNCGYDTKGMVWEADKQ